MMNHNNNNNIDDTTPKIPMDTKDQDITYEADVNTGNYAIAVAERHPIDTLQRNYQSNNMLLLNNPYQDLHYIRSIYGTGLAMEIACERQIYHHEKFIMNMNHISTIYNNITTGNDTTLHFNDYMSLPNHQIQLPKSILHPSIMNMNMNMNMQQQQQKDN